MSSEWLRRKETEGEERRRRSYEQEASRETTQLQWHRQLEELLKTNLEQLRKLEQDLDVLGILRKVKEIWEVGEYFEEEGNTPIAGPNNKGYIFLRRGVKHDLYKDVLLKGNKGFWAHREYTDQGGNRQTATWEKKNWHPPYPDRIRRDDHSSTFSITLGVDYPANTMWVEVNDQVPGVVSNAMTPLGTSKFILNKNMELTALIKKVEDEAYRKTMSRMSGHALPKDIVKRLESRGY